MTSPTDYILAGHWGGAEQYPEIDVQAVVIVQPLS